LAMHIPSKLRYFFIFYPLQAAALLAVLFRFLRYNNLLEWDFPGHYAAIWYIKTHLLPWPTGWNPYFYCGYPQGLFYPPLAHYMAALLSMLVGIGMAIKLLILVSILMLPIAFYAFARRWGLDDLQGAVCSALTTSLLFLSGEMFGTWNFGSDLRSILNIGLFANAISLPILFAFLATCGKVESRNWRWPALWLGLLFLTHPLSSLIAGIFALAIVIHRLWQPGEQPGWRPLVHTLGIALLLGSFWVLPFVTHRGFMNPEYVGAEWSTALELVALNGAIVALACFSKTALRPLVITFFALANFILLGTLWKLDLQFPRLTIYLLLLLPVFLVAWIKSKPALLAMALLALGIGYFGYRHSGLHPEGVPDFQFPDFGLVEGRILSIAPPSHLPAHHVNHELIPLRTGNEAILGLFIESGLNGRILADLVRTLDLGAYIWGTPTESLTPQFLGREYPAYVLERLRLFDIRYVYTDLRLEDLLDPSLAKGKRYINSYAAPKVTSQVQLADLRQRYNTYGEMVDFYLYSIGSGALAEPLPYVPLAPGTDWKLTNLKWFLEMRGLPIFTDRPAPPNVRPARPGDQVELFVDSPRKDRLILQIHADQDIPVLVKVGYFPNWKLTVNGKPAPIYRASPNLMLVFGHGPAVLEYRRSWTEYAGLTLSLLGLVLLVVL